MKQLIRISFDTLVNSVFFILFCIVLTVLVDDNILSIFTLTYPIQLLPSILKTVFATGPNILKEKHGRDDDVFSALTVGIIITVLIFFILLLNIDNYINFMNGNYIDKKELVSFFIIEIFFQTILGYILTIFYYKSDNELANKVSLSFNLINLIVIILAALIFDNNILIILTTTILMSVYLIILLFKVYKKFIFKFNILEWIKYDLVSLVDDSLLLVGYLFSLSSAMIYGEQYSAALAFSSLITDIQWDISYSISTVAKINISKKKFNYKEHLKNSYKLIAILILSIFVMFIIAYPIYKPDLLITFSYLIFHIIDFIIYPVYRTKTCYLQLEYSIIKTNINNLINKVIRVLLSLLVTPYATVIAQLCSSLYQYFSMNILFLKHYKINNKGNVINR